MRLNLLTLHTASPMGQQNYERAIAAALRAQRTGFDFRDITVGSLRSSADRRLPLRVLQRSARAERVATRLVLGTTPSHRFDLRIPPPAGPEVVTVHDLPPARFADEGSLPPWAWRSLGGKAVICPSEFAASEVRELLRADDVTVIPYGVRESFRQPRPASALELARYGIKGRFVLHAAGATARKGLRALATAWEGLATGFPDVQLVLCGPPHPARTELFQPLPRTVLAGALPLAEVPSLMAAAELVIVPSIYEGFGLPALEAMAVGTPAVVARAGALPEVVGDAAMLVEPDPDALASGIERVLLDSTLAASLATAGLARSLLFDWSSAARRHLDVYERVFGHG